MPPSLPGSRSGLLVAWGSAWLAGRVTLDRAAEAVCEVDEEQVTEDGEGVERLLTRLRASGAQRLALVLPVPGDVLGLPGPSEPLTRAAIEAGEGVLAEGAAGRWGAVPSTEVLGPDGDRFEVTTWQLFAVSSPAPPAPTETVSEAEVALAQALRFATRDLTTLDTAQWHDGLAEPVAQMRRRARRGEEAASGLPEGYPPRAASLLARADRLQAVLTLAGSDPGGSGSAAESQTRSAALRGLATAVRLARLAAYNSYPVSVASS